MSFLWLVPVAALTGLAGCSGAGNQDLFEPVSNATLPEAAGAETPRTATDSALPAPSSPASPGGGNAGGAPAQPGAAPAPGTAPAAPGQEPAPEQPVAPAAACTAEAEPNNNILLATTFATGLCGKIDNSTDADFGTFVVPAGAQRVDVARVSQGGGIKLDFFRNGQPIDDDELKPVAGRTYQLRVTRNGGNASSRPTYEITVAFQ